MSVLASLFVVCTRVAGAVTGLHQIGLVLTALALAAAALPLRLAAIRQAPPDDAPTR